MTIWLVPLEGNPEVLNKYIYKLGVSKKWNIVDILSLEPEMLEWVPQPVKAVIILFPCSDAYHAHRDKESAELKESPQTHPPDLFFMQQTIRNACGTIALVHSIANCDVELEDDGTITKYLNKTRGLSREERGKILEEDEEFIKIHKEVAQKDQTEAPDPHDKVDHHFVALVNKDGQLYELDGCKDFPVKHGATSDTAFLQDAVKVCKVFMQRDPEEVRFSVIALTATHD
ncbi:ubiquitin carboxyl-terminal hydrolase-like [Phlebotomus argentipes]|uniref:ubiquitin carboxyl-terminal hydrolase-like n=1 Tax=Phlebotomus argentipes TaxID=94469 RepID=UPI002893658C|nr:ubiquitin carboxyl-terminal hydrolase-like [Phlebotomus argentipes]